MLTWLLVYNCISENNIGDDDTKTNETIRDAKRCRIFGFQKKYISTKCKKNGLSTQDGKKGR